MKALLLAAAGSALFVDHRPRSWMPGVVVGAILSPLLAVAAGSGAGLVVAAQRIRSSRRTGARLESDVTLFAELAGLGVSSGLSLTDSFRLATRFVGEELQAEVGRLQAQARVRGLAAVLTEADGYGRDLYRTVARSVSSGAPLAQALQSFVVERNRERRAARLEAAKRLPMRVMIPIALLILPGFVLVSLGPLIVTSLEKLIIP
jgi:tight adherence protein C